MTIAAAVVVELVVEGWRAALELYRSSKTTTGLKPKRSDDIHPFIVLSCSGIAKFTICVAEIFWEPRGLIRPAINCILTIRRRRHVFCGACDTLELNVVWISFV